MGNIHSYLKHYIFFKIYLSRYIIWLNVMHGIRVFSLNRYLHSLLCKNQTVTEANRSLLVETLRSISEILIWGDQNDSSVFEWVVYKKYCIQNPLHAYFYFWISSYGTLLNVMKPNFHWHICMNQRYMYFLWVNQKNLATNNMP